MEPPLPLAIEELSAARHRGAVPVSISACRRITRCHSLLFPSLSCQIEGWGDEASYFVVSDQSRVRVEALLLFDESRAADKFAAGAAAAAAAAPAGGTADRAHVSGSSVAGKGEGGARVDEKTERGKDESIRDGDGGGGGSQEGTAGVSRSLLRRVAENFFRSVVRCVVMGLRLLGLSFIFGCVVLWLGLGPELE